MSDQTCPYCHKPATLVNGVELYGRGDLITKKFWSCDPCDAHVGCHGNSRTPLGRMANAELRRAKMRAHEAFDTLWKSGIMTRTGAYAWLSHAINVPPAECHIGMFDVDQCQRVVDACANRHKRKPPQKETEMNTNDYAQLITKENTELTEKLKRAEASNSVLRTEIMIQQAKLNTLADAYEILVERSDRRVVELRGAHKGIQRMQRKLQAALSNVAGLRGQLSNEHRFRVQADDALRARVSMDEVNASAQRAAPQIQQHTAQNSG